MEKDIINMEPKEKCPWCDSKAIVTKKYNMYRVECSERFGICNINCKTHSASTPEEAIKWWDTRVNATKTNKLHK